MELYFLKSAACLAVLLLFYKLLLEKEDMHVFNRFYLLLSVVLSFLVPLISFTTYLEVPAEPILVSSGKSLQLPVPPQPESDISFWMYSLWILYSLGALFFGIKFFLNLKELALKIRSNLQVKDNAFTKVLLKEEVVPHTFLDYIFLNRKKFEENQIPREVFEHEEAHASQKHSYDILFMELLQVVFWFHPLLYLTKNAIKLNHEFLADKMVLKKGTATAEYQQMLLAFSSGASQGNLAHFINYSFIKKRFTVMKTQTPKTTIWARSLLVLPLAALLLYGFSTKKVVERQVAKHSHENALLQKKATPEMIEHYNKLAKYYNARPGVLVEKKSGDILEVNSIYELMTPVQRRTAEPFPAHLEIIEVVEHSPFQEKATPEMIEEYNKLARYYNTLPEDQIVIRMKDLNRMRYIHGIMTEEQKKQAEPLPGIYPPPPPPAPAPPAEATHPEVPELPIPPAPKLSELEIPGPPPPPPAPLDHMKELAELGARFFLSGKGEISAREAIKIVEENKHLQIRVTDYESEISVHLKRTKE